jgi:hypothetical protein
MNYEFSMSSINIFEKGKFEKTSDHYRLEGLEALQQLHIFQEKHNHLDTDTTINSIRDTLIAHYLDYDLVNTEKHGFDAKNSSDNTYLEIKQCSFSSDTWGGTWNDTNIEKAKAFSDPRLFTAVAIWQGASKLKFIVYGQQIELGQYLLNKVVNRKAGSRSTQTVSILKLIKDYGFKVLVPAENNISDTIQLITTKNKQLSEYLNYETVKRL